MDYIFSSSVIWSVLLRGYNDKEGYAYQFFIVSLFLWMIRVAGCLLGITDSNLHVIYRTLVTRLTWKRIKSLGWCDAIWPSFKTRTWVNTWRLPETVDLQKPVAIDIGELVGSSRIPWSSRAPSGPGKKKSCQAFRKHPKRHEIAKKTWYNQLNFISNELCQYYVDIICTNMT